MNESKYRRDLENRLERILPGCFVLRNPCTEYQGIPDLTVFCGNRWAMLEIKRSPNEPFQPNQEYYIGMMHHMSFAAVIFPENEDAVLEALVTFMTERWYE